ncbi:MAG: nucleoside hydrolase [Granulosicoccus sp.]|nr:nucleoside hydrolase [Granulosicoccus sp.]
MHKVILDTDPGVDDAMAIAYALLHPDIDLIGLSTVFGNTNIDSVTRNAQFILDTFGATTVAVAKGAAVPSVQAARPHSELVHGADGIGNIYPETHGTAPIADSAHSNSLPRHQYIEKLDAADFIIQSAKSHPGEITLVAVGPLTNVAEALRREPALPSLLSSLLIMGGAADEPGNVTPLAEANFFNDPHAADALFAVDWPATIVGLDVTHRIMIKDSELKKLNDQAGDTGSLIWRSSRFYVDFYTQRGAAAHSAIGAAERQCAMHDAAAVAYLLIPDAFTVQSGAARVIPDGIAAGQLAVDRKGYPYATSHWQDRPAVNICMTTDADRVLEHFLSTLIENHIR